MHSVNSILACPSQINLRTDIFFFLYVNFAGLWECDALDKLTFRFLKSELYKEATTPVNRFIAYLLHGLFNMQSPHKAFEVGKQHYDTGEF